MRDVGAFFNTRTCTKSVKLSHLFKLNEVHGGVAYTSSSNIHPRPVVRASAIFNEHCNNNKLKLSLLPD